ncbi:PKD domain-containing protein [Novosphingobium sp. JCM 18896]|uniref:PKD domain-containing protein n=1 Tax=Novosphingobium sp. JCM 18896 TaxID=2989731 RepID=UPI0022235A8B|nr:PKD domain-containing protein [Novosphingobium sp. JCM 18896]MCW1429050.1 PKD domain-containing protein [Novosphingobium sp. JCM 18896]
MPIHVTADSIDPDYADPFVDISEDRTEPVPHRYVSGGFKGTDARFSFYFPLKLQYQGRFFHNTYPMAVTSDIGPFPIQFEVAVGDLGFTLDSGAYYVQTNNGLVFRNPGADPAIAAYRVNAAAAKFSRQVAAELYGEHRPWGYLFGGSGGAYQTMGAAENTSGVWDGFVPFVPGCNHAIPSMFTVRMHALRVLRQRPGVFARIADAVEVGGSGDPYEGLTEEEAGALREVTLMGFPPRGWYLHETLDSGYFANISGMIPMMDPTYAEDFWSKPGYLGTDPTSSIGEARFRFDSTVAAVSGPPFVIELADLPEGDGQNGHLVVLSGESAGASLPIARVEGRTVHLIAVLDHAKAAGIRAGDQVRIDNSWALALETYHRHQVPPTTDYYGWNQFRDAAGQPIYPQRPVLVGPAGTANAAGAVLTGNVQGKVLMLSALMDIDAYAWQADWYRSLVREAKGADFADNFALWFVDRAHHENPLTPLQRTQVASFSGALQQALRDLAAWVETGRKPSETNYAVADTQVIVPAEAAARGGVQPVVDLLANGNNRAEVAVGEEMTLTATITVPPGAGKVVSVEWDLDGSGDFTPASVSTLAETMTLSTRHAYAVPGTYFAVVRVGAHRQGDPATPYARVLNLARARIVVR